MCQRVRVYPGCHLLDTGPKSNTYSPTPLLLLSSNGVGYPKKQSRRLVGRARHRPHRAVSCTCSPSVDRTEISALPSHPNAPREERRELKKKKKKEKQRLRRLQERETWGHWVVTSILRAPPSPPPSRSSPANDMPTDSLSGSLGSPRRPPANETRHLPHTENGKHCPWSGPSTSSSSGTSPTLPTCASHCASTSPWRSGTTKNTPSASPTPSPRPSIQQRPRRPSRPSRPRRRWTTRPPTAATAGSASRASPS